MISQISEAWPAKVPVSKIAVKLGRSEGAVMAEASKLKLIVAL